MRKRNTVAPTPIPAYAAPGRPGDGGALAGSSWYTLGTLEQSGCIVLRYAPHALFTEQSTSVRYLSVNCSLQLGIQTHVSTHHEYMGRLF
jgi:hypothetical protein